MDDDGFSLSRIYRAIARAEAIFNDELRTPEMETQATLAVTTESIGLPEDFEQLRTIYQEGTPDRAMASMSPAGLRYAYAGQPGCPRAYAIEGQNLLVGPVGEASLTIIYFASIPALTDSNPSNWLLSRRPDLYLHQVLAILFNKIADRDKAAANLAIANSIIERVKRASSSNRWGAGPLVPTGIRQTYGARM